MCPSRWQIFRNAHLKCVAECFRAGVQVVTLISDACGANFEQAVHGKAAEKKFHVLWEKNGTTLELHTPDGKPPVCVTRPPEHMSHVVWQALKIESRLWLLQVEPSRSKTLHARCYPNVVA